MIDTDRMTEQSVEFLDAAYQDIVERAKRLAEQYFEQARLLLAEVQKTHVPVVITIRQTSPNACSFYWARVHPGLGDEKGKIVTRTIPKGLGHKYPTGAFSFVKGRLNRLVRSYENRLAELRQLAAENRALRRSTLAWAGRYQRVLTFDDLTLSEAV
ncbi:conjugative transfer protein MobI(A/C) [Azotobacter armeniacus]